MSATTPHEMQAQASATVFKQLQTYVGRTYEPGVYDCAHLAADVQREVFGRMVPLPVRHAAGSAGQRAAILNLRDAVAMKVDVPYTGCAALFHEVNNKVDQVFHIGTVCLQLGEVWVLHNSYALGGVHLHRFEQLQGWGMKLDGWYAWK
jgi:hypothetical protein